MNIFPVMSKVSFQTFSFQSVRLTAPNTFHEALQVGDVVVARKMLEQLCHHDLHLQLSYTDRNGHNACRIVVERGDEQMFDMLLPFLLPEHFVFNSELDGLSAIQRAVDLNPKWYTKFNVPSITDLPVLNSEAKLALSPIAEHLLMLEKGDMSPETVYLMLLDLEDMDNGEKYEALWKDFLKQDAEALSTFILKCLKRDFRKLAWKMLRARTSSINRKCLVELLKAAMECDFPDFFIDALEVLPKGVSIVCEILESGKKRYLDIFLDMKREFTLFDSINIVGSDSISKNTLSDIMDRGLPLFSDNRGLIPRFPGFDKFCLLLQAGFFPNEEKLFLQRAPGSVFVRFGRPDIVLDDDDVPTLQTLAVNQIRQALICSQKKSMQFVCKSLLGDVRIPQILKPSLVQPYTKAQMQLIMFVRAGPWQAC